MKKPDFETFDYILGWFSPIFTSKKAIKGHFKGMSLGMESADATEKRIGSDHIIKKETSELDIGKIENENRYKIACYIYESWLKIGKNFSTERDNNPLHEAKISRIEWENFRINYCPTKRNKLACEQNGYKPFKPEKMLISDFLDGYFTGYIYMHSIEIRRDDNQNVISIIDKTQT